MKKAYKTRFLSVCILTTLSGLVLVSNSFGQSAQRSTTVKQNKGFVTKWKQIPFDHQVFIENHGQFDGIIPGNTKILYGAQLGDVTAYFTLKGVEYYYKELAKKDNGTEEKDADEKGAKPVLHYMNSTWDNPNPSATIAAEGKQAYYYTYPKGTNATIKTDIFKKITYKNIYPGIDIEYIFPKGKEGLEYSLILHPGADISKVKLKYETLGGLKLEKNGDVTFNSAIGEFTDHSPISYYKYEAENIAVSYKVEGNTESFSINEAYDKSKTLVIDPWSTDPLFTGSYDRAYDIDYDYRGNVYAYGSWSPCQLEKFNNLGAPQWVFNATAFDVYAYYGDVAVNRVSGTAYLTEGFNASGARAMKINALGFLVATSPGTGVLNEFWRAVYNPCQGNIIIGAGGTGGDNQACILDTTMASVTPVNILSASAADHDIVLIAPDPSGLTCYMATAKSSLEPGKFNNLMLQLPLPSLLPPTYMKPDNFKFAESNVPTYVGPGSYTANGFNGMAASPNWLYVYDGASLKRVDKSTGLINDSIAVSNTSRNWGGLDVDPCDDIFLGCRDTLKIYKPTMVLDSAIKLAGTIYDVVLGQNNLVYAGGQSFVCAVTVPPMASLISTATGSPSSCSACNGKASVTINCGVAPFSFKWSDGSTNQNDTALCAGLYTVTVTDGSCPPRLDSAVVSVSGKLGYTATVVDSNPGCALSKGNITVFATGGTAPYTYNWSNGESSQKDTGLAAGTYSCTITDNVGCKFSIITTLINPTPPTVTISPTPDSICLGSSTKLTASGAKTYTWNPGALIGTSVTVSPLVNTTYTVFGVDSNGCTGSATITVVVNPVPTISVTPPSDSLCAGSSVTLNASGASTYTWTPATGLSCNICPSPLATPSVNTTYTVIGANGHGCTDTSTVTIIIKPKPVPTITVKPANDTICNGDSAMLVAGGGGAYDWTFSGSPKDTVWVKPASSTIYTLQTTLDGCIATVNTKIIVIGAGTPKITVSKDSICKGDSTMLTASGGGTYKWLVPGNPTNAIIWVKPGSNATYSVVVTTPCGNDTAVSKLIHVFPYPVITSSGNTSICRGNTANISAGGGTSYIWSPGGSTNSTISVNPNNTTTYTVTVSNGNCSKDTTITVTVDTAAVLTISPPPHICVGDSTILTATGGPSYKWNTGATTSSITVKPGTSTTYTCVVTKNGCIDSISSTVTVDVPLLNACCDTTIVLGASATINGTSATNYFWSPNSSLSCDTCASPVATPSVTTTYTVLTKDSHGCTVVRMVTVYVETPCADFTVPNIFTPNNDGRNDDFVITVLNPTSYSINIYDRWGKEVYTSSDPTVYWNGKVMGTQYLVSNGVYYYIIKATCGSNTYNKKGFVQVIGEQ